MTDGQIYLDTALFNSGVRPAVNVGLSVSRIGNKVQCPAIKELSSSLRLEYLRYNELVKITRFKTNVSVDVNQRLRRGEVLAQLFSQENNKLVIPSEGIDKPFNGADNTLYRTVS